MKGCALIFGKEAAPKLRSGSYADGIAGQSLCLPLAVVGPHVNLPSSDHSEVASDENRFASCFLALCAKALSEAKIKLEFKIHFEICRNMLESWERLIKSTSSALSQNKRSICHFAGRRSLIISFGERPKLQKLNSATKILISSGIASPVVRGEIRTANPAFPVPNPLSRPFGSANSHFPYRIDPLCTGGAFDGLWYRKHPSGCTRPVSNPVPCEKPAHFCTRGGGSARSGLNDWRWTAQNRVQREETDCAKQGSTTGGGLRGAVCSKIISMYTLK